MIKNCTPAAIGAIYLAICSGPAAVAQVNADRANQYFGEAAALCAHEGGSLWKTSLCGPIVIYDASTKTIATNQPAPAASKPPVLGYANAAMDWGGTRWSTLVWQTISQDQHLRAQLMVHEFFHRIQPQLGLLGQEGHNEHLDTLDGRYLIQLEWRALARALGSRGQIRQAALSDAVSFRGARRRLFPDAGENERRLEINEGLAQYTATVVTTASLEEAEQDAVYQLMNAPLNATFIRTFPYGMGAAYGLLLDSLAPGWRQRIQVTDDLGGLAAIAANVRPQEEAGPVVSRYGGRELRSFEERRDAEQKERVAELRRRFVDGPVLLLPPAKSSAFTTAGMIPIPGVGTLYPKFRGSGDWGTVDAASIVVSNRGLIVPSPMSHDARSAAGDGWKVAVSAGWKIAGGARGGDYELVRELVR